MFHFTDKSGFDAIRSQPNWRFLAQQPRRMENPKGAYFTASTFVPPRFNSGTRYDPRFSE